MPDIITSKIFVDGEKGITATKLNQIISVAVIQPDFVGTKPSASTVASTDQLLVLKTDNTYARAPFSTISSSVGGTLPLADATQNGMMRQVSGLTTDVVDGTNHCVPFASFAGITQMRLRSFNAIGAGNPTFEVDQRNIGAALTNPADATFLLDRWKNAKNLGAGTVNVARQNGLVLIPGTSFAITQNYLRFTVGTVQTTLASANYYGFTQTVEGPQFRELSSDVHSLSLLVRSSVAGLLFGAALQDPTKTRSLTKLCTIPAANTWTLITLPNIPVWDAGGSFSGLPGTAGYLLSITLACGTNLMAPANDVWQNANYIGAPGMANFLATSGSTFDIAFVQHEPNSVCTTLMDCPFLDNLRSVRRYWQKSVPYAQATATISSTAPIRGNVAPGSTTIRPNFNFEPELAIGASASGVYIWNPITGVAGMVYLDGGPGAVTLSAFPASTTRTLGNLILNASQPSAYSALFDYWVDTGW